MYHQRGETDINVWEGLVVDGEWKELIVFFNGNGFQEMLDIMKSIYDMMGKYTYPCMQEDAPREHVENFFQVSRSSHSIHQTPELVSYLIWTEILTKVERIELFLRVVMIDV